MKNFQLILVSIMLISFTSCNDVSVKDNAYLVLKENPTFDGLDEFEREIYSFPVDTTGNGIANIDARVWLHIEGKVMMTYAKMYWNDSIPKNPQIRIVQYEPNSYWQIEGIKLRKSKYEK